MLVRRYTLMLFLCKLQGFQGRINSSFCQRHIHIGVVAWAACKGVERPFSGMRFSNNFQCKHSEKKPKKIYFGCRRGCPQQYCRHVLLSAELLVWKSIQKIKLWQLTICEDIQTGLGLVGASRGLLGLH